MEVRAYIMRASESGIVYKGYQSVIGSGVLEGCYIYPLGNGVGIACCEDAVILGRTLNRAVYDGSGRLKTVLAGNLAAVRYDGKCFGSIQKEDIKIIEELMKPIERIAYGKVFLKEADGLPEWTDK